MEQNESNRPEQDSTVSEHTPFAPESSPVNASPCTQASAAPEQSGNPSQPGANVPPTQNPVNPGPQQPWNGANPQSYSSTASAPRQAPRSPYENSPYAAASIHSDGTYHYRPQTQPPVKPPKKKRGTGKKVVAALLVVLLAVGCSFGTAFLAVRQNNANHDRQMEALNDQIENLQRQLDAVEPSVSSSQDAVVISGSGKTPSQVYAENVSRVVAIRATVESYGQVGTSSGSGFILTEDGYVVTNAHVVEDATSASVVMNDGTEYQAVIVGSDTSNDVAVLKVNAQGLPTVTLGSSSALAVGDMVVAIGNPLGTLNSTQTVGYVCGKDREVTTGNTIVNMIQTDAAINSGNSGGPLFNMNGEVIGITSAKYSGYSSSGATIEGIGFAIPINDVMNMLEDLKEYGYLRGQASLGVIVQNANSGVRVSSVVEGSCAETAGIEAGDIITKLGEDFVGNYTQLAQVLRKYEAGDSTTVTVLRNGHTVELTITFDEKQNTTVSNPQEEIPDEGSSYEEWYDYFEKYFGGR